MSQPGPAIPVQDLARIGPYFAIGSTGAGSAEGVQGAGGWRRANSLAGDAKGLGQAIDQVAARLGTSQRWIAASIFYQGLAARLTAVYAGSAVLCGAVPDLGAERVRYRLLQSGPLGLIAEPIEALSPDDGWRRLDDGHLEPLAAAVRRQVRIGGHLLRGNVGSALAGALSVLAQERHEPLEVVIGQRWAQPAALARAGRWVPTPEGPRYARRTCCGYERLQGGGRCGDCSLNWHGRA